MKTVFEDAEKQAFLDVIDGDEELGKLVADVKLEVDPFLQDATKVVVFGKEYEEPRRVAHFGPDYQYAGKLKKGIPLTDNMKKLLEKVNEMFKFRTNFKMNGMLVNLYRDGKDYIGYHSDNEKGIDMNKGVIALSVGASRRFVVKSKKTWKNPKSETVHTLNTGPLQFMHMRGSFQRHYLHGIPKERNVHEPRYSFTFRRHLNESDKNR